MVRQGEEQKNWFRSNRFTVINGQLFFQTREGKFEGPFENDIEAELDLMLYLRRAEFGQSKH
ncbi:DUF6316 family protein [Marinobacter caseinilyticus]|uniref:DUF6316 family protein n=1 Tax=Marinobacter caseinilyticus TaxID=2692195 RepID=UPI00140BF91D|nr:DUF6316 family protein [Marinobacter caseinilyticus]